MPRSTQRIEGFSSSYPADTATLGPARQELVAWLGSRDIDGDLAWEVSVVLSELLANAVHATAGSRDHVGVAAHVTAGVLVLEVCNPRATWVEPDERWDLDDPLRVGGRGLLIVRSLVDDVEVEHDPAGTTTVRCRIRVDQRG